MLESSLMWSLEPWNESEKSRASMMWMHSLTDWLPLCVMMQIIHIHTPTQHIIIIMNLTHIEERRQHQPHSDIPRLDTICVIVCVCECLWWWSAAWCDDVTACVVMCVDDRVKCVWLFLCVVMIFLFVALVWCVVSDDVDLCYDWCDGVSDMCLCVLMCHQAICIARNVR